MIKAFILGIIGVSIFSSLNYISDNVLYQGSLTSGNHMPVFAYGGLILFLALLNPLLFRLKKQWALTPAQLAVILAMVLTSCTVSGFGLLRTFGTTLLLPHYHNLRQPGWNEHKILDLVPKKMLADPGKNQSEALFGFVQGMGVGGKHISLSKIPWYAWTRTLTFWLPFVFILWIALISLSVIVHKQWSEHEHLPYPIAKFANAILPSQGSPMPQLFLNRSFQVACLVVCGIHMANYLFIWFPNFIQIPTRFNFESLGMLFPTFSRGGGEYMLRFQLYFTVIAFGYFLSSSVSLSLGIGPIFWFFLVGLLSSYGISVRGGGYLSPRILSFLNFGAYLGFALITFYWGRQYYLAVFKRALFLSSGESIEKPYVWSARMFLACFVFLALYLIVLTGLDWQLSLLYMAGTVLIFLVMGRIVSETGLFYIQAWTFPCVILWGFFGEKALGPQTLAILLLVSAVILLDPRESIFPYLSNSFKLIELHRASIGKTAVLCGIALAVGLAVALPTTFYFQYDRGANFTDQWTIKAAGFPFDNALQIKQRLISQGNLDLAQSITGWNRFFHMTPKTGLLIAFIAGMLLVVGFSLGHVRFSHWPLHPVLFLVWATDPAHEFAVSFLLGWLIRHMVVKYGGEKTYTKAMPVMFGLIAGDMIGGFVPVVFGFIYYFATGYPPPHL